MKFINRARFLKLFSYVIIIGLIYALPKLVGVYTDLLWFEELGFTEVFTTILGTKIFLGLTAGLLATFFIYINLRLAAHFTKGKPVNIGLLERASIPVGVSNHITRLTIPISLLFGFLVVTFNYFIALSSVLVFFVLGLILLFKVPIKK